MPKATWQTSGPVGFSVEGTDGQLRVDDTADIDTRWEQYVCPGPALSTVDCSGAGGTAASVNSFCGIGGLSATPMILVARGTKLAKIKLSDATQLMGGSMTAFGSACTRLLYSQNAAGTEEITAFLASDAYKVATAIGTGATDTFTANGSSYIYRIGAQGTPANVVALLGKGLTSVENRVDFNILTGSTTMATPTIVNKAILQAPRTFTGFAGDDDHWLIGSTLGIDYQDARFDDEFRPLKSTLANSADTANGAAMLEYRVKPIGVLIALSRSLLHLEELDGGSCGPEVFDLNTSAFQGRVTALWASDRWGYGVLHNTRTDDRYLFAFEPRELKHRHPNPVSFYTLRKLSSASLAGIYTGTLGGRTLPTNWLGKGTDVQYFAEGLDPFMPKDSNYTFATSGTLRLTTATNMGRPASEGWAYKYKAVRQVRLRTLNLSTTKTLTISWTGDAVSGLGTRLLNVSPNSKGMVIVDYDEPSTAPQGWALKPQIVWASDSSTTVPVLTSDFEVEYDEAQP